MSRVKIAEKKFFFVFFPEFFRFLSKNFSDFWPENFKKFSKLPSARPEEHFVTLIILLKFWTFLDFLQKPWYGSQKFIYVSRVKIAEKIVCFCFLFRIYFRILSENFSDYWPTKFQQFFKNYLLRVQRNNLWLEIFFVKFWIVSDFLHKLLAWFSKFYLRVQSKKCGKKVFFLFSFQNFFDFWAKIFQIFGQKTSKSFQNYLLRVQRNSLWLEIFI